LWAPYVSIEVRDSATNQVIFATSKAVITTRSEEIRVDQLASVTLRWRAIGFQDEKVPAPMTGYADASDAEPAPTFNGTGSQTLQQASLGTSLSAQQAAATGGSPSLGFSSGTPTTGNFGV
jgi:hypothetical protein